ncbi:MAG: alanine--tRNA ligase [Planctomycetota bacterium]|jgi:alanyl-tRNA synthetase
MKGSEIRAAFLKFFEERGHTVYPSDSLIPTADPSLLFTGAGMNQFKDAFLGKSSLKFKRAATSQKCLRTGDIENVGVTPRHHTFFEMLGNFSFGDYFKREAIEWAWEFSLDVLKLPEEKLAVSVYEDDEEAFEIWRKVIGLPKKKIYRFGEHDNFWPADAPSQAPAGMLCGPCSELFYDWGKDVGCGKKKCSPACECGRWLEYWNLVFQQFEKGDAPGKLSPLTMKNIDTGAGLERIAAIMQGVFSNFDTDLMLPLVKQAAEISGHGYGTGDETDRRLRRIADHARAVTFAIGDGVLPANEGRGYVVRRLLRRAVLDGRGLGVDEAFLYSFVPTVASLMGDQYPDIIERREQIASFVKGEEERFGETLASGLAQLERFAGGLAEGATLDGKSVFMLYDTYGFPVELTEEMLAERGVKIDRAGFDAAMAEARERSRGGVSESIFGFDWMLTVKERTTATEFVGYEHVDDLTNIVALVKGSGEEGRIVEELTPEDGDECQIVLERTPFYGEAGGQVGDTGTIEVAVRQTASMTKFEVTDTVRAGGIFLHRGRVVRGGFKTGDHVMTSVDRARRLGIARNHTATHLLHHALREKLGKHVEQAGSFVSDEHLRLDFSHGQGLSRDELDAVELAVNLRVLADDPVAWRETSVDEAKAAGAMALFGEKYGESVRMVSVGAPGSEFSKELCGGTHLGRTGEIGLFRIVSEESVAAGVRRITAVTGRTAYDSVKDDERVLGGLSRALKAPPDQLAGRVESLMERAKRLERDLAAAKKKALTGGGMDDLLAGAKQVDGVTVLAANMGEAGANDLRSAGDVLKAKLVAEAKGAVLVLAGAAKGKVALACWVAPKDLAKKVKAGSIVKKIAPMVGGGGGGRDDMAQAGGKDPSKIDEALAAVEGIVRQALGG